MSLYLGSRVAGIGDYYFTGLAYGNNTFVLTSSTYASKILYKVGAANWTYLDNPNIPITNVYAIKYCNDRFLAIYNDGLMYSLNGITWTKITSIPAGTITSFDYFKGKYYIETSKYVYPTGNVLYLYSTADLITYTNITLPSIPVGKLYSNVNILCFVNTKLPANDIGKLVYTLDGNTWYYKTSDYYYKFVQYDYNLAVIPVFTANPVTFSNYFTKAYTNNLLIPDNIVDCTQYTQSTPVKIPKPIVVIWDGTRHVYISDGYNVYTSDLSAVILKSNIETYFTGTGINLENDINLVYTKGIYFITGGNIVIQSSDLVTWTGLTIGTQNTDRKVLIATRESKSIEDIKSTNPRDCEFHSDLPYINIKVYEAESIIDAKILYYSGYIYDFYSGHTYGCAAVKFPDEFYSNYSDRLIIVVANDTELSKVFRTISLRNGSLSDIPGSVGHKWIDTNFNPNPDITYVWNQGTAKVAPSSSYKNLLVPKIASTSNRNTSQPYTLPNVKLLVITNVKKDGTFIPYYADNTGIRIDSNYIFINGYNLYNTKYLSNIPFSVSDTKIDTEGGSIYVIGDVPDTGTGMQLISSPINGTKIVKGGSTLFDTLYGKRGAYLDPSIISNTYSFSAYYGTFNTYEYDIFSISSSLLNSNKELNILLELSITSTNIKHNGTIDVITAPNWVYYNITKTFGSMFITLRDSTPICVGVDEYYYYVFDPNQTKNFRFCEGYIIKTDSGGITKIKLVFNTNVGYLNTSAYISAAMKARVLI